MKRNGRVGVGLLSLLLLTLSGCGHSDPQPAATSNDEIAQFVEQNPEFAAPNPSSTDSSKLGVGR